MLRHFTSVVGRITSSTFVVFFIHGCHGVAWNLIQVDGVLLDLMCLEGLHCLLNRLLLSVFLQKCLPYLVQSNLTSYKKEICPTISEKNSVRNSDLCLSFVVESSMSTLTPTSTPTPTLRTKPTPTPMSTLTPTPTSTPLLMSTFPPMAAVLSPTSSSPIARYGHELKTVFVQISFFFTFYGAQFHQSDDYEIEFYSD